MPVTGYKQVDLVGLYRQVGLHGGCDMVSDKKWWRNIGAHDNTPHLFYFHPTLQQLDGSPLHAIIPASCAERFSLLRARPL